MWAIMSVRLWKSLEVKGQYAPDVKLNFIDERVGCIGFIPVFDSKENAEQFADGKYGVFQIAEVKAGEM